MRSQDVRRRGDVRPRQAQPRRRAWPTGCVPASFAGSCRHRPRCGKRRSPTRRACPDTPSAPRSRGRRAARHTEALPRHPRRLVLDHDLLALQQLRTALEAEAVRLVRAVTAPTGPATFVRPTTPRSPTSSGSPATARTTGPSSPPRMRTEHQDYTAAVQAEGEAAVRRFLSHGIQRIHPPERDHDA